MKQFVSYFTRSISLMALCLFMAYGLSALDSSAAHALSDDQTSPTPEHTQDIRLVVLAEDGTQTPVETPPLGGLAPQEDALAPYLIDFNQWSQCYSFNNSGFVLKQYGWINAPGSATMVTLKCGTEGYGYKHITQNHRSHWETVLANAEATGWKKTTYMINTWDDLMFMALVNAVSGPAGTSNNPASNKACANVQFGLVDSSTGAVKYSFRAEGVISMNNLTTITAFPSSRTWCNNV
ncbi:MULTISPECIES: hypothetical protein [unclassified Leucobacter]|uniref:hypothetical protein n=1 Tax=unclassified Leucobacter TaxID=2621730 RepID=UPI003016D119